MPCCTDRLSLMAGTYGSVDRSSVLTEQLHVDHLWLGRFSLHGGNDLVAKVNDRALPPGADLRICPWG